jgi:hypothetical protein
MSSQSSLLPAVWPNSSSAARASSASIRISLHLRSEWLQLSVQTLAERAAPACPSKKFARARGIMFNSDRLVIVWMTDFIRHFSRNFQRVSAHACMALACLFSSAVCNGSTGIVKAFLQPLA